MKYLIYFRNRSPVIELSTVDRKPTVEAEVDSLHEATLHGSRMTTREFWLSEHGIYLFLCFWTSVLIIGKTQPIFSLLYLFIHLGATPSLQSTV